MPIKAYVAHRVDKGSSLELTFLIRNQDSPDKTSSFVTEAYKVDTLAQVRFKFKQKKTPLHEDDAEYPILIMASAKLGCYTETRNCKTKLNYTCTVGGNLVYGLEQLTCTEHWTEWLLMHELGTQNNCWGPVHNKLKSVPIVIAMVASQTKTVTFANLYDDKELTDFNLSTSVGKVAVHRACLAAHSETFRAMLRKNWKETETAQIDLPGTTLEVLNDFKKYIYLGTVPDDEAELRQLLILGSYYRMDALMEDCIFKLSSGTTGENLHNLVEYACENNLPKLVIAILEQIPDNVIKTAHEYITRQWKNHESSCSTADSGDDHLAERDFDLQHIEL